MIRTWGPDADVRRCACGRDYDAASLPRCELCMARVAVSLAWLVRVAKARPAPGSNRTD